MFHSYHGWLCFGSLTSTLYDCGQVWWEKWLVWHTLVMRRRNVVMPALILLHNKTACKQEAGSEFTRNECEGLFLLIVLVFLWIEMNSRCTQCISDFFFFFCLLMLALRPSMFLLFWHCVRLNGVQERWGFNWKVGANFFWVLSRYEKYQGRWFYGCCSRSVVSGWILLSLCIETNDRDPIDYNAIKFLTFIIPD